jgi:hypothetical protein
LILYRMMLDGDWRDRVRETSEAREAEDDRYVRRLVARLEAAGDDAERTEAARRLGRWFCASIGRGCKRDQAIFADAETMSAAGMASHLVFDALDVALLADRPGLRIMLEDEANAHEARQALVRIGPPAVEFAPFLIDRLDAGGDRHDFDGAWALGSIGRDDPAVVAALLGRLESGPGPMQSRVAACLDQAGPALAGRVDEAVGLLIRLAGSRGETCRYTMVEALGSVGRDRDDAFEVILEMASPRPARPVPDRYEQTGFRDEVMNERGMALAALRFFPRLARRAMPVLIEAMGTFEEYDPDWQYDGAHGRICHTLAAYGSEAEAVVPHLVAYLEDYLRQCEATPDDIDDWPKAVFRALAAIGPAAAPALPVLELIRRDREAEEELGEPSPLDPSDGLDRAILAIRG